MYFIDIETIPDEQNPDFEEKKAMWDLFTKKFERESLLKPFIRDEHWQNFYSEKAGLFAEFGRVLCVSLGTEKNGKFYVKYFAGRLEKDLLLQVATKLADAHALCGHNIKEFDFPFLFRRMLVNGIPLPPIFQTYGKKPWELIIDDTMQMWSSTAWNYKCSLDLIAHTLKLPSPKAEMSGKKVADVWFNEPLLDGELPFDRDDRVLKKIGTYCMGDVVTTAKVYCRIRGLPELTDENIVYL